MTLASDCLAPAFADRVGRLGARSPCTRQAARFFRSEHRFISWPEPHPHRLGAVDMIRGHAVL